MSAETNSSVKNRTKRDFIGVRSPWSTIEDGDSSDSSCLRNLECEFHRGSEIPLATRARARTSLAAIHAEAAYFGSRYGDFDAAVVGNLALQFLVEFAFKLANLSAAHARYMDMVAWAMAFVEMAVATQMKKVEFVN